MMPTNRQRKIFGYALQTKRDETQTMPPRQELANWELLFPDGSLFRFGSRPESSRANHSPSGTCTLSASSEGGTFPVFFLVSRELRREALGVHGPSNDVATLAPLLDDQQKEVRYRAAAAIIRVTSRSAA